MNIQRESPLGAERFIVQRFTVGRRGVPLQLGVGELGEGEDAASARRELHEDVLVVRLTKKQTM